MRKVTVWVLTAAGLVGLLLALGFEGHGGPRGSVFRMGYPDAWIEWDGTPDGHRFTVHLLRWSFGLLVAGVFALYLAARLRRTAAGA